MKKLVILAVWTVALLFGEILNAVEHRQLKAFPKAKKGMERFVIVLPHKTRKEEVNFKVELIAGKMLETDGVNLVSLGNGIEARPLKGWGYTYYEVSKNSQLISTMMAAPEGGKKVRQFVTGRPLQIHYNSRLPIVVYAPKGYEVKYRIWSAPEEFKAVDNSKK